MRSRRPAGLARYMGFMSYNTNNRTRRTRLRHIVLARTSACTEHLRPGGHYLWMGRSNQSFIIPFRLRLLVDAPAVTIHETALSASRTSAGNRSRIIAAKLPGARKSSEVSSAVHPTEREWMRESPLSGSGQFSLVYLKAGLRDGRDDPPAGLPNSSRPGPSMRTITFRAVRSPRDFWFDSLRL